MLSVRAVRGTRTSRNDKNDGVAGTIDADGQTLPVLTRFLSTADGVRLAWAEIGSGEPLVLARGWITHVELSWEDQAFRRYIEALARSMRVIRFDHRGMGLSDRDVEVPDLDTLVLDLEAIIEGLGLEQVALWGSMFGGPVAIRYAARHPERVSKLVLDTTWVRPADLEGDAQINRLTVNMIELMRVSPEPALATYSYLADPTPESRHEDRVARVRQSIAPDMLADLYLSVGTMDVEREAAALSVPTLVLHRRECSMPMAAGARIASTIPHADFVGLDGRSTNLWEGDTSIALNAMARFLGIDLPDVAVPEARGIAVLLMTDLVGSTATTARLGDDAAHPLQQFHDEAVRAALANHGGIEAGHTGDGIFARFSSAAGAVRCAQEIQDRFASRNLELDEPLHVRIGINAGEPLEGRGEMFGTAVQKAARVCAAASADEIFVTPVVRALVEGKGFTFADHGEQSLKGFAEPVRLYALSR